jgi:cadmium resistance protein CadD (predicted permease)
MRDYVNFGDLKSLILGIIGGLLVLGIQRYWSNRSTKSLKRRIEEKEAYKARLDNLARSDRALLITGFQGVFGAIAAVCAAMIVQFVLVFAHRELLMTFAYVLIWLLPIIACIAAIRLLDDIRHHPESLERIERQITALKNKLLGQSK